MAKKRNRKRSRAFSGHRARQSLTDTLRFPRILYDPGPYASVPVSYTKNTRTLWAVTPAGPPRRAEKPKGGVKVPKASYRAVEAPVARLQVCESRSRRKEVIHAIGRAGRSGQKPQRRRPSSEVKC